MAQLDTTLQRSIVKAKRAVTEARRLARDGKYWSARIRYRYALDTWKTITRHHLGFGRDRELVAKEFERFNASDKTWLQRKERVREALSTYESVLESQLRKILRTRPPADFDKLIYHLEKDGFIRRKKVGNDYKITLK
jgi:hypothetical protein